MVRIARKGRCGGALMGIAVTAALFSAVRPQSDGCAFAGARSQTRLRRGCATAAVADTVSIPASVNGGAGYEIDKEYLAEWAAAGVKAEENSSLVQTGGMVAVAVVVLGLIAFLASQGGKEEEPAKAAPAPEPVAKAKAPEAAVKVEEVAAESPEEVEAAEKVVEEVMEKAAAAEGTATKAAESESDSSEPKVKEVAAKAKAATK